MTNLGPRSSGKGSRRAAGSVQGRPFASDRDSWIRAQWHSELGEASRVVDGIRASMDNVVAVSDALIRILAGGGCVFVCGNGGSALAAQHFCAELLGHFRRDRPAIRSVALTSDAGLLTAIANDYSFEDVFSRQLEGLATSRDALIAFSTSGRSANMVAAVRAAKSIGAMTVALLGGDGGALLELADHALVIPALETARIQEGHLILIHLICERIDAAFSGD